MKPSLRTLVDAAKAVLKLHPEQPRRKPAAPSSWAQEELRARTGRPAGHGRRGRRISSASARALGFRQVPSWPPRGCGAFLRFMVWRAPR